MNINSKIYIAGHMGMVGSAIKRKLQLLGYRNLICRSRQELDLLDQAAVADFFIHQKPEYVFMAAAKVGGIMANKLYKADFIYENLEVQNNIIVNAYRTGVSKLLFLGSSCIYPRESPQPIREEYFMSGRLEETNDAYAVAKIAGIKMCQAYREQYGSHFISVMPTNLYGQNDNFEPTSSHVFPAMIRRMHDAKTQKSPQVTCWGDGSPRREFMYVDDMAAACIHLMHHYDSPNIINIGTGEDISIKEFAELVKDIVGYTGHIVWDRTKPNGTLRKLLDVSRLHATGFHHKVDIREGIRRTYEWFLQQQ